MTLTKRIDIRAPYAEHAAYASDQAHEQYAYAQSLADAHRAANMTPVNHHERYDSDDIWERLSNCLHRGGLSDDWLRVELDGRVLTVEYGDHDPVNIDANAIDTAASLAARVLDDLSEHAINRLTEVTRHTLG